MRALTIIVLMVAAYATAQAATIRVPGDYATIQAAINAAQTGDLVLVSSGTYVENIDFHGKAIRVASEMGPEYTTIRSGNSSASTVVFISGEPAGAELTGFTVTGGGLSGIRCQGSSPTIIGNIITGNMSPNHYQGAGITLEATSNSVVKGNIFRGNSSPGYGGSIVIRFGCTDGEISYNLMYDNVGYGEIRITELTTGLRIYNNTIRPTTYTGITHQGTGSMDVQNNIILDAPNLAIRDDAHAGQVQYNCTYNNNHGGADYPYTVDGTNLRANPMFVDVPGRDFHLQIGSPCLDRGNPDPAYDDPDGTRNDLGALPAELKMPAIVSVAFVDELLSHVINHAPVITWTYHDSPASTPSGYEIEVGTDNNWSLAEMWATGPVTSDLLSAGYEGAPLDNATTYFGRIRASNGTTWGGWRLFTFHMNAGPETPVPVSPVAGDITSRLNTRLTATCPADLDNDNVLLDYEVYLDPGLSGLAAQALGVARTPGATVSPRIPSLEVETDYWWRVRAFDGYEYSEWTGAESFHTRSSLTLRVPEEYATIQEAVAVAGASDLILVGPGTYYGPIIFSQGGALLRASEGADKTTITDNGSGNGLIEIGDGDGAPTVIEGFTFYGSQGKSAVSIGAGAAATITDCIFSTNAASNGGGINCQGTDVTISRCRFESNRAYSEGGGIFIRGSSVVVEDCEFHDNVGEASGGAIYSQLSSDITLRHNTVFHNSAGGMGGGFIYAYSTSNVAILNNTVVGNSSGGRGAGVTIWGGLNHDLRNNIVTMNTGGAGLYASSTTTMPVAEFNDVYLNDDDYVNISAGIGSISADPQFIDPEYNDYGLQSSSPCIDAGDPDSQYNDDDGSRSDMGSRIHWIKLPAARSLAVQGENLNNVVGNAPVFTWQYFAVDGSTQQSYECQVGTNLNWDVAEMWASGEQMSSQESVVYEGLPLVDGASYYVRVRLSDGVNWGEWRSARFHMNSVPQIPDMLSPVGGAPVSLMNAELVAGCVTDAEGDPVSYDFEIYSDAALTILVYARTMSECLQGTVSTGPTNVPDVGAYWWRIRVSDTYEFSAWSGPAAFQVHAIFEIHVPSQYPSVGAAISAAADGTRIVVADGIYLGPDNRDLSFDGKLLQIVSEHGALNTIIDCEEAGRAFYLNGGESNSCLIQGFTIRNGATSAGGALRIQGASVTVRDCIFQSNAAPHGGAVYINTPDEAPTFINCRFEDNDAQGDLKDLADGRGGAVYGQYGATDVYFTDCLFTRNRADYGGAMAVAENLDYVIEGCTIVDNYVQNDGAGINGWNSSTMNRSIIAFNHGGVAVRTNQATSITIRCTDIFGNPGGDWTGELSWFPGLNGNIQLDPVFCLREIGEYAVRSNSPCAPANNNCQALMGALGPDQCMIELPIAANVSFVDEVIDHVLSSNPTFAWTYIDNPASQQAAYELQVGTDADWSAAEMWMSGQIWTNQHSALYAGAALGKGIWYRARLRLYNGLSWGSWIESSFRLNTEPSTPVPTSPQDNQTVHFMNTILTVNNAADNEFDGRTYEFEVYRDMTLLNRLGVWSAIPEQTDQTSFGPIEGLTTSTSYWWRVRAHDGYAFSAWSAVYRFQTAERVILRVPANYPNIQAAVTAAYLGDKILLSDGVYTGTGNKEIDLQGKTVTIESENGAATTIIDCQNEGRAFFIHRGEGVGTIVKGLTIRNGNSTAGAGMRLQGASATVVDCVFENNVAPHGGAVYANTAGTGSSFTNCTFIRNSALGDDKDKADGHGGAIYIQYGPTRITFTGCVFAGNAADLGGAIKGREQSSFDLISCTVVDNASEGVSSALSYYGGRDQQLIQCVVAFNRGGSGAGFNECSPALISCNDIFGNEGGDWVGCLEELLGTNNNFSSDPRFCGFLSGNDDYRLRRRSLCLAQYSPCGSQIGARGLGTECTDYLCGDANDDEMLAWTDVIYLKDFYFGLGPVPRISSSGDPNCDGWIKLNDILYLIDYLRGIGPAPCCSYDEKPDAQILPPTPFIQPKNDSLLNQGATDLSFE